MQALDLAHHDNLNAAVRNLTSGRGPDSVIYAVGLQTRNAPERAFAAPSKGRTSEFSRLVEVKDSGVLVRTEAAGGR